MASTEGARMNNLSRLIRSILDAYGSHAADYTLALYHYHYTGTGHWPNPEAYQMHENDAALLLSKLDEAVALDNPVTLPDGF